MRRVIVLGGSTFAGILVTGSIYLFIQFIIFSGYPNRGEYDFMALPALSFFPLSLFAGSCLTGYLSQAYGQKKLLKNLFLAPGFYTSIPLVIFLLVTLIRDPMEVRIGGVIWILVICLLWISFSIFGISLGSKIRARRQYRSPSLDL
jgi:hypothetical protein